MKLKQLLLFCLAFFCLLASPAQDVIFRKNGDPLKVTILNRTGETITYRSYQNDDSIRYHIAVSIIDSIRLENGQRETFMPVLPPEGRQRTLSDELWARQHRAGFDLFGLFFTTNLTFSYEFLPKNTSWGFKAVYQQDFPWVWEDFVVNDDLSINRGSDWYLKFGVNRYFPKKKELQGGVGASWFFGRYSNSVLFSGDLESEQEFQGLSLNACALYHINKLLAFSIGCEYPVLLNFGSKNLVLHGEIFLSF